MHSGGIAPPSQSKGAGVGVAPLVFSYPSGDLDIAVEIYDDRDAVAVALAEEIAKVG